MLVSRSGYQVDFSVDEKKLEKLKGFKQKLGEKFPKFGVLVLSYNAADHIEATLSRIDERLYDLLEEIFIFDDNSPDDTYSVAQKLADQGVWKNKLSVYKNPRNLRYGGNQKVGYQYAIDKGLDYVIMLHGDGQYAPEYIVDLMLPALEESHDVVFASRMMRKKDALKGGMPLYKFIGNQVLTRFENFTLGTHLTEFHSGYRMYSTKILKRLPIQLNTNDFHFDTEIIIQCRHLGAPIKEVPIKTFYGDEECNVDGIQYALDVCKAVIGYRLHQLHIIRKGPYLVNREFIYQRKLSPYGSHEKILQGIKPGSGKILCIGDSDGLLYESLKTKGHRVIVADTKKNFSTMIPVDDYIEIDLTQLKKMPFKREFDYIILCDVLPRVAWPGRTLSQLQRFLSESGSLIVTVPNIALWVCRFGHLLGRFNYSSRGPMDRLNLRFFTRTTIQEELVNAGLVVQKIDPTGLPFEVVFSSSGRSRFLKFMDTFYYLFAKSWQKLFSYQFVVTAFVGRYESAEGEKKLI